MVARDHDYYQINSNVLWPVAEYAILWKPMSDLCCGRSTHRWEFIAQSQTVQEFMFYFCQLHNCIQLKYLGPISNNAYFNFTHRTRCMLTTMSTQNPLFLPKRFSYLSLSVRLKMWECWWKSVQSLCCILLRLLDQSQQCGVCHSFFDHWGVKLKMLKFYTWWFEMGIWNLSFSK